MAGKNEPFEVKRVNASFGDRKVQRLAREGWEIVSDRGGALLTARTVLMRRPNPRYRGARATEGKQR